MVGSPLGWCLALFHQKGFIDATFDEKSILKFEGSLIKFKAKSQYDVTL